MARWMRSTSASTASPATDPAIDKYELKGSRGRGQNAPARVDIVAEYKA